MAIAVLHMNLWALYTLTQMVLTHWTGEGGISGENWQCKLTAFLWRGGRLIVILGQQRNKGSSVCLW